MHIAFVSRELGIYPWTGGIGAYVWDFARWIVQNGHKCTVICSSYHSSKNSDEKRDGVRIITIQDDHLLNQNPFTYPFTFKKNFIAYRNRVTETLDHLIDTDDIDIVEFPEYNAESYVWQNKTRIIPMVVRWHTPIGKQFKLSNVVYYPIIRWLRRATINSVFSANAVTFPSHWMAERVGEIENIRRLFYRVIHNGVNYSEWSVYANSASSMQRKEIQILYAGTFGARKGFSDLISAVKILRKEGYPIILTLVGKKTKYSDVVFWKERKGIIKGWLRVIGYTERRQLGKYYGEADICCFPSWFETLGIVCLEAMACGGIVIGSANSGMAEVIEDGIDGFLAPPKAPKELSIVLKKALNLEPEKKREMKQRAAQKIQKNFDNSVIASKVLMFYQDVIEKFKR